MPVTSIDTYLKRTIDEYLQTVLSSESTLREKVLTEFEPDIVDSFINTFCTDGNHQGIEIPVDFVLQSVKTQPKAQILIQEKHGEETNDSIGQVSGSGMNDTLDMVTEMHDLKLDEEEQRAYYEVDKPIHHVESIDRVSNIPDVKKGSQRIYIDFPGTIQMLLNALDQGESVSSQICYFPLRNMEGKTVRKTTLFGFDSKQDFVIDLISSNMSTLRCLSVLMRFIMILMGVNQQKQRDEYNLGRINWSSTDLLEQLNNDKNSTFGNQTYLKRINISFTTIESIDLAKGFLVDKLGLEQD